MKRLALCLALIACFLAAPVVAQPSVAASPRWKPPVANLAALPATGNTIGDTRIALDTMVHYTWDGDSWETAASGGGSGTVTSIALAVPSEWTVSGSPVTTAGTITIAEATQTANTVYAGPTTGAAAAPGFRALVSADIPNNAADTSGNAATATTATTAATANAGDSATAFFSSGTIEAARLPAVTTLASSCTDAQVLGGTAAGTDVECQADDTGTDDQTATEVAYTPTTGTDWTDPDPTSAGEGLDDLAARLTVEEAKADDDVPESGDFGAATDLDADGSVSADSVALGTDTTGNYVSSATASQGLTLTGTEGASLGLQTCTDGQILKNSGGTSWACAADATGSGIGGSTGATDLGIIVANGTGGSTVQASAATLTTSGSLTIPTGQTLNVPDGSEGAPSIIFGSGDTNTGIYQRADGYVMFVSDAAEVMQTGTSPYAPVKVKTGIGFALNLVTTVVDVALVRSATNVLTVTDGTSSTSTGKLLHAVLVEANTAVAASPNAIAANESGTRFTNEGATAANYHTLPTAVAGYVFTFIVQDADGIRVVASAGDTIQIGATTSTSGGYCESTTIGDSITLVSVNASQWFATSYVGSGFSCS